MAMDRVGSSTYFFASIIHQTEERSATRIISRKKTLLASSPDDDDNARVKGSWPLDDRSLGTLLLPKYWSDGSRREEIKTPRRNHRPFLKCWFDNSSLCSLSCDRHHDLIRSCAPPSSTSSKYNLKTLQAFYTFVTDPNAQEDQIIGWRSRNDDLKEAEETRIPREWIKR